MHPKWTRPLDPGDPGRRPVGTALMVFCQGVAVFTRVIVWVVEDIERIDDESGFITLLVRIPSSVPRPARPTDTSPDRSAGRYTQFVN